MSFPRFAFNNVRRNARAYFAYFLSSAFMVLIFFSFAAFAYHPEIKQIPMGKMTSAFMMVAQYVIFLFAVFFVLYSISMFLKSRNREFGILLILGAQPSQINRLTFLENLIIGAGSIVTGVAGGLLLFKLFMLLGTKMMDMRELPFYWPKSAILLTVVTFIILFVCVSWFTLLFIRKSKVLELLQGNQRPKKEPRASILWSLIGLVLLAVGWMSLYVGQLSPNRIIMAAVTGIAGTYFFYSQLSVFVVRLLKRSRKFTWRGTNLVWVSEMAYKIKDNARILFLVTVVTSIACMSGSGVIGMIQTNQEDYVDNPFVLKYFSLNDSYTDGDLNEIDKQLNKIGVHYRKIKLETVYKRTDHAVNVQVISASIFNELTAPLNLSVNTAVDGEEAIWIDNAKKPKSTNISRLDKVTLESGQVLSVAEKVESRSISSFGFTANMLVVSDEKFYDIKGTSEAEIMIVYHVPEWNGQPPRAEGLEAEFGSKLEKWFKEKSHSANYLSTRIQSYLGGKQVYSLFAFIGLFVAFIFSVSSASFLYFKLYTELASESKMYQGLSKVGLSTSEMRTSSTLQIALLFFVPILVSFIQTLVVIQPILETMFIFTVYKPALIAFAAFLFAQTVYFFLVRWRYLHRIRKMMV
ncbi:ABC transporter permease protein YxdM [compost metagenome]